MRRSAIVWQCALLAAVGCSAQHVPTASVESPSVQAASGAHSAAATFVSLKVPNMH